MNFIHLVHTTTVTVVYGITPLIRKISCSAFEQLNIHETTLCDVGDSPYYLKKGAESATNELIILTLDLLHTSPFLRPKAGILRGGRKYFVLGPAASHPPSAQNQEQVNCRSTCKVLDLGSAATHLSLLMAEGTWIAGKLQYFSPRICSYTPFTALSQDQIAYSITRNVFAIGYAVILLFSARNQEQIS